MVLDELIILLSDESKSLTEILLKTKVFLHEIGKKEIAEWVTHELSGYPEGEGIPPYRQIDAEVQATLSSMTWRVQSHPIPLGHLKPETRERLTSFEFRDPIAMLQDLLLSPTDDKSGRNLIRNIPMESNARLGWG